ASGQDSQNSRDTPSAGQRPHGTIAQPGRLVYRRRVQVMTPVLIAIAAIVAPHSRIFVLRWNSKLGLFQITNAAGPRVIPLNGQAVRPAMLHGKQQPVIIRGRAIVELRDDAVILSLITIL